jgi:hypothetical protein
MIKQKTIKNLVFINTDFEWGASEAPGGHRVRRYVKAALVLCISFNWNVTRQRIAHFIDRFIIRPQRGNEVLFCAYYCVLVINCDWPNINNFCERNMIYMPSFFL